MLQNAAEDCAERSPSALESGYRRQLREVVSAVGPEAVAAETGLDAETVAALAGGDRPTLTVEAAAAILAVDDATPDAEGIVFELRDHLLMGMTTAVLDVEAIAANIDVDLTGQEVQQAIEGRIEMTLEELAAIQAVIEEGT